MKKFFVIFLSAVLLVSANFFSVFAAESSRMTPQLYGNSSVVFFGAPDSANEDMPSSNTSPLDLGGHFSSVSKSDGSLWMWGKNDYGQIGDGSKDNSLIPKQILTDASAVSLGGAHSAALMNDGSLWLWGDNTLCEIGDGTRTERTVPIKVLDEVMDFSMGSGHSAAIKNDGSLWLWGSNSFGEIGAGTDVTTMNFMYSRPKKILDDVTEVSLGAEGSAAIKSDKSLWVWGFNQNGQVGDGTKQDRNLPKKILEDVEKVSLGSYHSAAIKNDGSLWVWGWNNCGQIGDGTRTNRLQPVKVMDNVASVSLGFRFSAAITKDGSLWMWGQNNYGQVGNGTTTDQYSPVKVMDDVVYVSLGDSHSAAIKSDGSLWLWGQNDSGQIGDGTTEDRYTPVKIMDNVIAPVDGGNHTHNDICSSLPKMTPEEATYFLCFLYNKSNYKDIQGDKDTFYKILTGDYSDYETAEDLQYAIGSFLEFVTTNINTQIGDSKYRIDQSSSLLIKLLEKELDGMDSLEQEIVNEKTGKLKEQLKKGLIDIGTNLSQQHLGTIISEDVLDTVGGVIDGIKTVQSAPEKAMEIVNRVRAAMEGAIYVLNQEIKGRTEYFSCYLQNRPKYSSPNDSIFQTIMDYNFTAIKNSSMGPKILAFFTWIIGKDDWTNHRDLLDRWGEVLYQLSVTPVAHDYEYTMETGSCTETGVRKGVCKNCGNTIIDTTAAPGHRYSVTYHEPTCTEDGYAEYNCKNCGELYYVGRGASTGHHWNEGQVVKVATTVETGIRRYTCVSCMATRDESIPKLPENYIPVESVQVSQSTVTLPKNSKKTLNTSVYPDNATNQTITWFSSNPSVASIENGKVTAGIPGRATLICKTEDGDYMESVIAIVDAETQEIANAVGHSTSLKGDIGVNYYMELSEEVLNDPGAKIVFTHPDGTIKEQIIAGTASQQLNEKTVYRFQCDVASTQMTAEITAKIVLSDGTESNEFPYSAKTYAEYILDNVDSNESFAKAAPLIKQMLNYGGYAQQYFQYDEAPLANAALTEEEKDLSDVTASALQGYQSARSGEEAGLQYYGSSLVLKSKTSIRHYFEIEEGHGIDEYTFMLGDTVLTPVQSGKYYYAEIPDIASGDLDTMYDVNVGDFTIRYSALSYAYTMLENEGTGLVMQNLMKAMYKYNQAANEYFGR